MPLFSRHTAGMPRQRFSAPGARAGDDANIASSLLQRYRPLETRAAGGFGSVEVCLDARLQRRVAIKRIPLASRYSTTPAETRSSALVEARTASMLQHPNIVTVIDFAYDESYAYLVMEYIDGMSLEEFLAQVEGSSLTYDEAAAIADALVQALSFAHDNGVLHLDIKPANVLIDRNGNVKLADFGMATLTTVAGFGGARGGTIGYMPPEQLAGDPVDARTDIFALAAVLYESLCATAPFRAGTPADSLKRIKKGVLYPSTLLPDIPEPSEEALVRALSPDPDDRMASVAEFGDMFLARLGGAREGRKSLARMIARLTSDEADPDADAGGRRSHAVWELDPAEGYLGSRSEHARRAVIGVVAGVSATVSSAGVLSMLGMPNMLAELVCAAAIGLAAVVAPQLASALVAMGLVVAVASSTEIISALPALAVILALFIGWWYVWGRKEPAGSAVFVAVSAAGLASGNVLLFIGPIASLAGYFLAPVSSACTVAVSAVIARLMVTAFASGGELGISELGSSLIDTRFAMGAALAAGTAAAASALLAKLWRNMEESRGRALIVPAVLVPGFVVLLLLCLANPMEIGSSQAYPFIVALGVGALSSIIICMCTYLIGYRKESSEGDRA